MGVSALFSPEIISKTTPEKLIRIPKICLEVVFVFQNNAPTIIVKIGIIEFIIPAMLLLTLVSAIGKRNIGIKLPANAANISHFICFFGNFFLFRIAIGDKKTPEINTLSAPTWYGEKCSRDFLINIKEEPQIRESTTRIIHFSFSAVIILCYLGANFQLSPLAFLKFFSEIF